MANCKSVCTLCPRLVISQTVTFTGGNLIVNLPADSFRDCDRVCIVVAQSKPATTTILAPVYVTIGTGTQLYPVVKRNCRQLTACELATRTKYSACVETTTTGGIFRLLGNVRCCPTNLRSINGTPPATAPAALSE